MKRGNAIRSDRKFGVAQWRDLRFLLSGPLGHPGRPWVVRVKLSHFDVGGKAKLLHQPNAIVVNVELPPSEAVLHRNGMRMVVVVPAFSAGEQRNPPVVA